LRISKKINIFTIWVASVVFIPTVIAIAHFLLLPPAADAIMAADPSTITACADNPECFAFTIDTRMTNTLDTDPTHYDSTATTFSIPTSGYVGYNGITVPTWAYSWIIDWGDGSAPQTCTGLGVESGNNLICSSNTSTITSGIPHTYVTAGQYQITIRPSTATTGWFNAFGFTNNNSDANTSANKYMFKSIDTPFTNLMRTQGAAYRFAFIFYGAYNGTEIPANLFANVLTTGSTNFSYMFHRTFSSYARNSTTATIPAGLFDSIDTSQGTSFDSMFSTAFYYYAYNSAAATIPAGLFDSIDTSQGTSFDSMFYSTFYDYAHNSTTATIPASLFDHLDTSQGTSFDSMFYDTFNYYAYNSAAATIPAGLFDHLNTSKGTNFYCMFYDTFNYYAYNSAAATIPAGLFDSLGTSHGTNFGGMFDGTFYYYAFYSTVATIPTGLFDHLNTSQGTSFDSMFYYTFNGYAYNSTAGTIPTGLFSGINTSKGTIFSTMFYFTFSSYARRTATFKVGGAAVGTVATFAGPYSTKISSTGTPNIYPTVNATTASQVVPTYDATDRSIDAPTGTYANYSWYTTDGTSCSVANPTPDCGEQDSTTLVSFPTQPWTPTTSTEQGNVTFYGVAPTYLTLAAASDVTINLNPASNPMGSTTNNLTVTTNDANGYNLSIAMQGTDNRLSDGNGHYLNPITGSLTNPAAFDATNINTWGFAMNSTDAIAGNGFDTSYTAPVPGLTAKFAAVPIQTAPLIIRQTSTATELDDNFNIYFGARADLAAPAGVYSGVVVYTAICGY